MTNGYNESWKTQSGYLFSQNHATIKKNVTSIKGASLDEKAGFDVSKIYVPPHFV
jgi:hypothetical protein